ncbi:hypothetical protein LWC34_14240 [Kibdelosporangium philippinense]|uniref:Secreted protein n=1 Tax=Kibdelosporangium philippinense TaxID=211113 RepID=A0ABS8Z7W4_9PSEU|nr:hypothetical protein [Kibdelosporangium philippinense]MCE7003981.1 hypothetical protein [Kibdelosporangium philippinense]
MKSVKTMLVAGAIALLSIGAPAVAATADAPASAAHSSIQLAPCGSSRPGGDRLEYRNCGRQVEYIRPRHRVTGEWWGACREVRGGVTVAWWLPTQPYTNWYGAYYTPVSQCH